MSDNVLKYLEYETRNLGVPSYAVTEHILDSKNYELLENTLKYKTITESKLFVQARINLKNWSAITHLEHLGFSFIETTLSGFTKLKENIAFKEFVDDKSKFVPKRYDIEQLYTSSADLSDCTIAEAIKAIAEESFIHDRFHLDPHCPSVSASKRYVNWVEDLFGDSIAKFQLLSYAGKIIGFSARKTDHIVLVAFLRKFASSGLGEFLIHATFASIIDDGITYARSQLSANNIPSLNMQIRLGFKFRDPAAILHYWNY